MQSGSYSEISASTRMYQPTRRYIPEDFNLYKHRRENLATTAFVRIQRLSILYVNVCRSCVLRFIGNTEHGGCVFHEVDEYWMGQ
jgi:hypothetical protein